MRISDITINKASIDESRPWRYGACAASLRYFMQSLRSILFACALVTGSQAIFAAEDPPRPLRFVSDGNYPPFSFTHGNVPLGLGVDLARALAERLGRPLEIALLPWAQAQERVIQDEGDFLGPMTISPQRRVQFDFTTPFYRFEYVFLVHEDTRGKYKLKDFAGMRIGVTPGGYPRQRLKDEPSLSLIEVSNTEQAIDLLRARKIDAFAVDKWVAAYELGVFGVHDVVVAGDPFEVRESALAVKKGNAKLLSELESAMDAVMNSLRRPRVNVSRIVSSM